MTDPHPSDSFPGGPHAGEGRGTRISVDLAGMPAVLGLLKRLRLMQRRLAREGRTEDAAELDRILTDFELRK